MILFQLLLILFLNYYYLYILINNHPHQKPLKMKRQRTISQIREQEKTPEKQQSDMEIISLQEKDFRLLMLKIMQDIGNELEAKIDNLQETLTNKDFGKGFYLTDIKQQALDMAVRRTKFSSCGSPIVQEYEFDESLLSSKELKVKVIEGISNEWAQFILSNKNIGVAKAT